MDDDLDLDGLGLQPHWREAAEVVRQHLVSLRGGAPFFSPRDGVLLVKWLEEGVATELILLALERAARSRRKTRARTPLSLGAASRHLGAVTEAGGVDAETGDTLTDLRRGRQTAWAALDREGLDALRQRAVDRLGDLAALVDPADFELLVEEEMRALLGDDQDRMSR